MMKPTPSPPARCSVLLVALCLLAIVSSSTYSVAHEIKGLPGPTGVPHPKGNARAVDTDPTNKAEVEALTTHWYWHLSSAAGARGAQGLLEFLSSLRKDSETWASNGLYLNVVDLFWNILVSTKSRDLEGRSLISYRDANMEPFLQELQLGLGTSAQPKSFCVDYTLPDKSSSPRYVCTYALANQFYVLAGLDPDPDDLPQDLNRWTEFIQSWVKAKDVLENNDKETLKEFVDATAVIYETLISRRGNFSEIMRLWTEHTKSPWKDGNVYLYIMTSEGNTLFNALDRSLEGKSLQVTDKAGNDIWKLALEAVKGDGFYEYYWDDPSVDGDEVRDENGQPIEGMSPGNSFKIGYLTEVDAASLGLGTLYIGSGIYPKEGSESGCSISGSGPLRSGNGLLNLFLIVSVLLSVVSWKNYHSKARQDIAEEGKKESVFPDLKKESLAKTKIFSFVFFFALVTVLGSGYADAHQIEGLPTFSAFEHPEVGEKAINTDPRSETEVKNLAKHWLRHTMSALFAGTVEYAALRKSLRNDKDTWSHDSMHMIVSTTPLVGPMVVVENSKSADLNNKQIQRDFFHAMGEGIEPNEIALRITNANLTPFAIRMVNDPNYLMKLAPDGRIKEAVDQILDETIDCSSYSNPDDAEPRWVCFYNFIDLIIMTGLDPEIEASPEFIENIYTDLLQKRTTAADVSEKNDKETLKEFVDTVASLFTLALREAPHFSPLLRLLSSTISHEPWISDNIYLYIMDEKGNVVYNALDRSLEGKNLQVTDKAGNDIWELSREALKGDGFYEYYWDDPSVDGDEVRDENGQPIEGMSPGNSFKIGYLKQVNVENSVFPQWIIGSGIYLKEESESGCSISGSRATPKNVSLNLFLIASVLVTAVLWKSRSKILHRARRLN